MSLSYIRYAKQTRSPRILEMWKLVSPDRIGVDFCRYMLNANDCFNDDVHAGGTIYDRHRNKNAANDDTQKIGKTPNQLNNFLLSKFRWNCECEGREKIT